MSMPAIILNYFYTADGSKQRKQVDNGTEVVTTDYSNGYLYKNDVLEFFNHPEGYITPDNGNYTYTFSIKPGDGYLMVTVGGEPYWTDAIGQIPSAVDKFTDELESTGNTSTARQKTIEAGQTFGDGNVIGGESDNTNSYDNAMIKRAINWAEKRYKLIKESGWFGDSYGLQKTNHSPSNLSKQSDEK